MQPTPSPAVPAAAPGPAAPPAGRGWAVSGVIGGLTGLVGLFGVAQLTAPGREFNGDNAAFVAAIADRAAYVWAFQVVCVLAAGCIAVFAAGLRRHLIAQEPATSLVPSLAVAGLGLVVVMLTVGGGIATELYWALRDGTWDADTIRGYIGIYDTMAWVWGGAGLTAAAVAAGGLRHGSVGRPFAVFSALTALLVAATQLTPVQYMALVPAAAWIVVAGLRFAIRPA